jgi:hypothetical protein
VPFRLAHPGRHGKGARVIRHDQRVRADLSVTQWNAVAQGQIVAPDGTMYVRRTTKAKRRDCDALLADGAPLVLYYWAEGQLDWFDGNDTKDAWMNVRPAVTSEPRQRGLEWTAGAWESQDGKTLVLLTGHC